MLRRSRNYKLFYFLFNDTATTEIYTLSLHDALPISLERCEAEAVLVVTPPASHAPVAVEALRAGKHVLIEKPLAMDLDRKSTRLNSSHANLSYAVFCLKKKQVLQI